MTSIHHSRCRIAAALALMLAALMLASLALSACATSDPATTDSTARFLVAPGKYTLYNCAELAATSKTTEAHQHELEGLMAQASITSSGRLVNAVAYRPEYLTLRGEMMDLRQAAADKKCDFVPGARAIHPVSGRVIH
jgi:hypothetical protein